MPARLVAIDREWERGPSARLVAIDTPSRLLTPQAERIGASTGRKSRGRPVGSNKPPG
jgi:hypothetical protein